MSQESLKELRQQKGWSQNELAVLSGLSVKTIQRIENGQVVPSLETAKALGSVFDRSFSYFLPNTKTIEQVPVPGPASATAPSSLANSTGPSSRYHSAQRYWWPTLLAMVLISCLGLLINLYKNVEIITTDVSEIGTIGDFETALDPVTGSPIFPLRLRLEQGGFGDYYGGHAKYALQTYPGDNGTTRGVSLLEMQMLRDIARIVSAWGVVSGSNPEVRVSDILESQLQCYRNSRTLFDSASESIAKIQDCIHFVLSDANWKLSIEVEKAFESVVQAMEATSPNYQSIRLIAPQITQQ